jgi:hypothetical protein
VVSKLTWKRLRRLFRSAHVDLESRVEEMVAVFGPMVDP